MSTLPPPLKPAEDESGGSWASASRAGSWLAWLPLAAILLSFSALAIVMSRSASTLAAASETPSVFEMPFIQEQYVRGQQQLLALFAQQRYAEAETQCRTLTELIPHDFNTWYNLACAQARQKKTDEALASLEQAIERGFSSVQQLEQDADLESVRGDERFAALLEAARQSTAPANPWSYKVTPRRIESHIAWVTPENTVWDSANRIFRVFFDWGPEATATLPANSEGPIVEKHGEVGELLNAWGKEGTAAGLFGVLYDNHDADHSNFSYDEFPQLTRTEYGPEAQKRQLHNGLQRWFFFNAITFGNSSTSVVSGPFWRSNPRLAYSSPITALILAAQYAANHLYVYPEHRDHDGELGDLYPANTPYLLISQGSSHSDKPFLDAIASTLAAFRPEVRQLLASKGAVMPTLQMIFRMSNRSVKNLGDYLSGRAHPTVFNSSDLDTKKMVQMAHDMKASDVPPIVRLRVVEEDETVVGRDYFDVGAREHLFDTPQAIARIHRSTARERRMVVSAESSVDLNDRPLLWEWHILRGDSRKITIKPLNKDSSLVEIIIPFHEEEPIEPRSNMRSSRVDIGAFVHNGVHWSAPGFVSVLFPANEERTYDKQGRIESVVYTDPAEGGPYIDPALITPVNWRDDYHYDSSGKLLGWTRTRGTEREEFTAEGSLVTQLDDLGRPIETQAVQYAARGRGDNPPLLEQQPGAERQIIEYASPTDRVGRVKAPDLENTADEATH